MGDGIDEIVLGDAFFTPAASGSLSGYGAQTWLARRTSHAPTRVRRGPIPNPAETSPIESRRNIAHSRW